MGNTLNNMLILRQAQDERYHKAHDESDHEVQDEWYHTILSTHGEFVEP